MNAPAERRWFWLFPQIPFAMRMLIVLVCICAGLFMQFFGGAILPGMFLILVGALMGVHRGIKTEVKVKGASNPAWEKVTDVEWQRAIELQTRGRQWRNDISNIASAKGALFATILGIVFFAIFVSLIVVDEEDDALILTYLGDSLILLLLLIPTGTLSAWTPPGLTVKMTALEGVRKHLQGSAERSELEISPMFGFADATKENAGKKVPVDAKLMIRLPGAPDTFYGVQVQCSINTVGSAPYPYLYGVVLFNPKHPLNPKNLPGPKGRDLAFEPSQTAEAIVLVVRQRTTKTSGYHTPPKRQAEIVEAAIDVARRCLAG